MHQQTDEPKSSAASLLICLRAALLLLCLCGAAQAQSLSARISIVSLAPARVKIEGQRAVGATAWSFRNQYGSVGGLGERIENLALSDDGGAQIPVQQVAPGEFTAASPATRFAYEVKLDPPAPVSNAVYASWLTTERGLLLLGDLLPKPLAGQKTETRGATVRFILPAAWSVAANETKLTDGQYQVASVEQAVFLAGSDLRQKRERLGQLDFSYATAGRWSFTDEEVASMAADILKEHARVMGGAARPSAMLILIPFPSAVGADRWSAETRGGTVTLLFGQGPSKTAALAQLGVPLTHELFHLWVPNGLALDGDYDWFYEGFTSYQAMRAGMRLNLLTFQDYLNAVGKAFDAYTAINGRDQLSLIAASEQRWKSPNGLVYHKGLLVAFLYDLMLRQQTNNSRSLDDVYRELFRLHRSTTRAEGNTAVTGLLKNQNGMQDFVRDYIEKPRAIDLPSAISPFGLEILRGGVRTHLGVAASLSRSQRDLLRKFGYNEESPRGR